MQKPKLLCYSDILCNTGFSKVALNLYEDLHKDFDVHVVGINYHGLQPYDTSKYFVHPIASDDPLGLNRLPHIANFVKPDLIFLFQDIFHVIPAAKSLRNIGINAPIVTYFPIDGSPVSQNWVDIQHPKLFNKLITYSHWAVDELKAAFPEISETDVGVMYHGVDENIFHPLKKFHIKQVRREHKWEDKFVVLNVNRFQPRKGSNHVMKAFAMFRYGYYVDKDGYWFPRTMKRHPLQHYTMSDIVDEVPGHDDAVLYYHAAASDSRIFGPTKACGIFAQALNNGIKNDDFGKGYQMPPRDIMAQPYTEQEMNELYNAADVNITAAFGEGRLIHNSQVFTNRGWVPIQYVTPEDLVYTESGKFSKVSKVAKYSGGKALEIKIANTNIPIILSNDHRLLTKEGYVRPDHFVIGTQLAYRKKEITNEIKKIDLANYADEKHHKVEDTYITCIRIQGKPRFNRYITTDGDFGKLLGLYCAEGSTGSRGIHFDLHRDEKDLQDFIKNWFQININIFNDYQEPHFTDSKKDASGRISLHNTALLNYIKTVIWGVAQTKDINPDFYNYGKEFLEGFLDGWSLGDGYIQKNYTRIRTASPGLAQTAKLLVGSLKNYLPQINVYPNNGKSWGTTNIYEITITDSLKNTNIETDEKFFYIPVKAIEEKDYTEDFYDLQVPDGENYMIHNCISHNCGLSLIEASATGTTSIAPHNSAIPEMLGETGYLCKNIAHFTQPMDNGHLRPIVDEKELVKALEAEYQKWVANERKKVFNQAALDRVNTMFRWQDKKDYLLTILKQTLETK